MFGDKVSVGQIENVLDREFFPFEEIGLGEKFMTAQGYTKSERVNIREMETTIYLGPHPNPRASSADKDVTRTINQIGDRKITYVTPDKLNSRTDLAKEVFIAPGLNEIEKVNYQLIKLYGGKNEGNRYFESSIMKLYREIRQVRTFIDNLSDQSTSTDILSIDK